MIAGWFGLTHPGLVRASNEDTFWCDPERSLYIVADGMGGHNAGEVASALAVETVKNFVEISHREREFTWPFGVDPRVSYDANRLVTAVKLANRVILKHSETLGTYTGMGTTIVAAVLSGPQVTYVSVGDSRLYSFRDGTLRQLTRDDTLIASLREQNPQLDPGTLVNHPMRHVLTSVLGAREELNPAAQEHRIAEGETLLLCTDGLTEMLSDTDIAATLSAHDDLETAVRRLQDAALQAGGVDNITAVLARWRRTT